MELCLAIIFHSSLCLTPYLTHCAFKIFSLFMYFWLHWGFSLVVASRASSLVVVRELLVVVASLGAEHELHGTRVQELCCTGLAAPYHVESSWTREQTHIPCIGRWLLNHGPPEKLHCVVFII